MVNLSQFRPERYKHEHNNENPYGCLEKHAELRYNFNYIALIRLSHPIGQTTIKYCIWMILVILCGFFCFFVSGWRLSYLILEKGERKITCF